MQSNDFVTMEFCLSETMQLTGDTQLRLGLTKGYYKTCVQRAVEKLAIHTFFDVITGDFPLDQDCLQAAMPANCFNIREIYLWNGPCCSPESSVIVHFKRLHNNKPGGTLSTSLRNENAAAGSDPFYAPYYSGISSVGGSVYYANIQNGLIMFSSNAKGFTNYRIVYNGMGGNIEEAPIIPRMLSECIIDLAAERALRALKARDPRRYRALWADTYNGLYNERDGSFTEARKRIASMDSWMRDCYREYQSRGNW